MKAQNKIKHQMDNKFVKHFEHNDERLNLLEQAVFGKEGAEFRFEKLEKAQFELET